MAWLSGLADKAETLLNKIDQNTAAVLNKDRNDHLSQISSINHSPQHNSFGGSDAIMDSPMRALRPKRSDTNGSLFSLYTPSKTPTEEEFMSYLNTPTRSSGDRATGRSTPSSLIVEHSTGNSDSASDLLTQSRCTSPEPLRVILDISDNDSSNEEASLHEQNLKLKREIKKLRNDLQSTSRVNNAIESEQCNFRQKLETLRAEYEFRLNQQRLEMEQLIDRSRDVDTRKNLRAATKSLVEKTEAINKQHTDHQKELDILREKLRIHEVLAAENLKKFNDAQMSLERSRSELNATRLDLEQHRARALKTLQEKEKLIAELRNGSKVGHDNDTMIMELNQLRQECEALREENQQVREQLRVTREELINADLKIEETSRRSLEANREIHEVVSTERRKRLEAEEDARVHLEEVRGLTDELENQRSSWTIKFRKQENEITRLRSQISAISTPSSAVETRLTSLTQTLVSKQQALETLTTEKNALRLQLEKVEQEYRKIVANSRKIAYNSVNDTDDAKAQVPTFLMETPFDTGVARRVKRAYSNLDAISIRTGVFLRRYPLARIFIIIYMAVLQFWVLIVLFSQKPEAH